MDTKDQNKEIYTAIEQMDTKDQNNELCTDY
jgi:hypothetical protein